MASILNLFIIVEKLQSTWIRVFKNQLQFVMEKLFSFFNVSFRSYIKKVNLFNFSVMCNVSVFADDGHPIDIFLYIKLLIIGY